MPCLRDMFRSAAIRFEATIKQLCRTMESRKEIQVSKFKWLCYNLCFTYFTPKQVCKFSAEHPMLENG